MPKKLDSCVQKVEHQMIEKGKPAKEASRSAYAICSKSTGYVKTGAHTWEKKKKENLEKTHNYYKFGLCFKEYRKNMKNSEAWKRCLKKPEFQDMTKIIQGDNMNLNESTLLKIDTLLENATKDLGKALAHAGAIGTGAIIGGVLTQGHGEDHKGLPIGALMGGYIANRWLKDSQEAKAKKEQ